MTDPNPPTTRGHWRRSFQRSTESLLSYWSDSMSVGPNLPLHTLSKPVIRFLYHRQVQKFIAANENVVLSDEMMQLVEVYLGYQYLAAATKEMIILHLSRRLLSLEPKECFRMVNVFCICLPNLVECLESPRQRLREAARLLFHDIPSEQMRNWLVAEPRDPSIPPKVIRYVNYKYLDPALQPFIVENLRQQIPFLNGRDFLSFTKHLLLLIAGFESDSSFPWQGMLDAVLERVSRDNIRFEIRPSDPDGISLDKLSSDAVYAQGWNIIVGYIGTSNVELTWKILETIERLQLSDRTHGLIMGAFAFDRAHICALLDGQGGGSFMIPILLLQVFAKLATTKAAMKIMLDQELHCFLARLVSNIIFVAPGSEISNFEVEFCDYHPSRVQKALLSRATPWMFAAEFLHSSSVTVKSGACYLLAAIARHEKGCLAILDRKLTGSLLEMMKSSRNFDIDSNLPLMVLIELAQWREGAETLIGENGLNIISFLIYSGRKYLWSWLEDHPSKIITRVARQVYTKHPIFNIAHCRWLIGDLLIFSAPLARYAAFALSRICLAPGGVEIALAAGIMSSYQHLITLVKLDADVNACIILIQLGSRQMK
ncbi:hypothetical protein R3P38DRAFT_3175444 [Favolaschia claudopus]|uniref:Uncharacterized protein n=1 Tax=Favolaschia claudopus TaxID=2862362 RepID=A0AAW0DDW3_9AGAR